MYPPCPGRASESSSASWVFLPGISPLSSLPSYTLPSYPTGCCGSILALAQEQAEPGSLLLEPCRIRVLSPLPAWLRHPGVSEMGGQGLVFPVKTAVKTADPQRWCRRALRAAAPLPVLLSVMADPSVLTGKKNKTNTCFDSSHVPSALHSPTWRFTRLHGSVISSLTPVLGGTDWSPLLSGRAVCRTLLGVNGGQWAAASALSASS